jgi:hypothetical protein
LHWQSSPLRDEAHYIPAVRTGLMAHPQLKSVRSPDDVFRADKIVERSVEIGEQTIGRATIQPGWRWSVDIKPVVGTPSCTFRHLGIALSGRLHVVMARMA